MGYQVGRVCHKTHEAATNEVMTHVVPTIDKDGVLHHPVFNGKTWVYKEQPVKLTFPDCDPLEYYKLGHSIGQTVGYAMVGCFILIVLTKLVLWQRERNEE